MANEIITYFEMCRREGKSLQQGMNFGPDRQYSVILMSRRANAPYRDHIEADGITLIYEGHDVPRTALVKDPKVVDQVATSEKVSLTENGKFLRAAMQFKERLQPSRVVRVYEKLQPGIWSFNGPFELIDAWTEQDGRRRVYKFKLVALETEPISVAPEPQRRRIIPTHIKLAVWKRDGGQCVLCGAKDELHFDHDVPYSLGGSSLTVANVQLLCARHNLEKGPRIV